MRGSGRLHPSHQQDQQTRAKSRSKLCDRAVILWRCCIRRRGAVSSIALHNRIVVESHLGPALADLVGQNATWRNGCGRRHPPRARDAGIGVATSVTTTAMPSTTDHECVCGPNLLRGVNKEDRTRVFILRAVCVWLSRSTQNIHISTVAHTHIRYDSTHSRPQVTPRACATQHIAIQCTIKTVTLALPASTRLRCASPPMSLPNHYVPTADRDSYARVTGPVSG